MSDDSKTNPISPPHHITLQAQPTTSDISYIINELAQLRKQNRSLHDQVNQLNHPRHSVNFNTNDDYPNVTMRQSTTPFGHHSSPISSSPPPQL